MTIGRAHIDERHGCGHKPGMSKPEARARVARTGRRVGLLAFAFVVGSTTLLWASQILFAVFAPPLVPSAAGCRPAVLELETALQRARRAAATEPEGERPALARFRRALEPEWSSREWLTSACNDDPQAQKALRELDALRYAEEHAVRYEAVALAKQRRRADALPRELAR